MHLDDMMKQVIGWYNSFRKKLRSDKSSRCLYKQDLGSLLGERDLMKRVGHIEVYENLDASCLGQFMLNDRYRLLRDLDVLVDLMVIITKPDKRLSGFRSDDQRRGDWRFTFNVEILVEYIELFLSNVDKVLL